MLKVVVIQDFKEGYREYKKGDILMSKNGEVFTGSRWICNVGSPFFKQHLKMLDE
jgi:hypothetical protein